LTFCREHRLPSAHGCKGVEKWRSGAKPSKPVKARVHALKGAEPKKRDGKLLQAYLLAVCLASFLIVLIGPMLSEPKIVESPLHLPSKVEQLEACFAPSELKVVKPLAERLCNGDPLHDMVAVRDWVMSNIEYDWEKPVRLVIQRPSETLEKGRGLCCDRAVLIIAILLSAGYDECYYIAVPSWRHSYAGLKVNNTIYAIGEHEIIPLVGYFIKKGGELYKCELYKIELAPEGVVVAKL